MKAYSLDLRERVLARVQAGDVSQAEIAKPFQISLATVENWWRLWRQTHSVAAKPFAGGPPRTLAACSAEIRAHVKAQADATLRAVCDGLETQTGLRASLSMMCRELQILDLPRKKKRTRQSTRNAARPSPAPRLSSQRRRTAAPQRRTPQIHR